MNKARKLFRKARIWILLFFLLVSFTSISPQFSKEGVAIKGIEPDSVADLAGFEAPSREVSPTNYERILEINGEQVLNLEGYSDITSQILLNENVIIKTDKQVYTLTKTVKELGLIVQEVPSNNIRKGLDLQGGTRVLLKPETQITDSQRDELIQVMEYRLNTYGLSDVEIRMSDDLLGNKYILVEIAGATKQEVSDLIASQGNFEARIGNDTAFRGGREDITFVCRNDGTCAGVSDCNTDQQTGQEFCRFEFVIHLSPNAAKRHAEITSELEIITTEGGNQILE